MITAGETLNSIEQAHANLRQDEDRLSRAIESASTESARLRSEQAALYKSLARLRLQALQQEEVLGSLDEAEQRAVAALEETKQRIALISRRRELVSVELARARAERADKSRVLSNARRCPG